MKPISLLWILFGLFTIVKALISDIEQWLVYHSQEEAILLSSDSQVDSEIYDTISTDTEFYFTLECEMNIVRDKSNGEMKLEITGHGINQSKGAVSMIEWRRVDPHTRKVIGNGILEIVGVDTLQYQIQPVHHDSYGRYPTTDWRAKLSLYDPDGKMEDHIAMGSSYLRDPILFFDAHTMYIHVSMNTD
jgi:hypothetical protein